MTVFEHIEKLKRDYTDKFVLVDDRCAELARFKGQTGRVKTVNMNGRALVEFDHYSNIGWFDIDVDYLKVIDRPVVKDEKAAKTDRPTAKKSPAKAPPASKAADKKPSPLEMARMQDSGTTASAESTASGAMSIAEKLAAARGNSGATTQPDAAKQTEATAAGASAKDPSEMTIAEKLAAARANAEPAEETVKADGSNAPATGKDPAQMTIAEKLAAARKADGSGK